MHPPALPGNATSLTLGCSAPDSVLDPIVERVFQTRALYRAIGANPAGNLNTHAVAREEGLGRQVSALPLGHPGGVHCLTSVGHSHEFGSFADICIETLLRVTGAVPVIRRHPPDGSPRPGPISFSPRWVTTPRAWTLADHNDLPVKHCSRDERLEASWPTVKRGCAGLTAAPQPVSRRCQPEVPRELGPFDQVCRE
jgi:hypothetical protein